MYLESGHTSPGYTKSSAGYTLPILYSLDYSDALMIPCSDCTSF